MNSIDVSKVAPLEQEVRDLRRQLKQLRVRFRATCTALAISAFICALFTGAAIPVIGRFQKAVEVDDGAGRLRAVLYADDGQNRSGLQLRDPAARVRLGVITTPNHDPVIAFTDARGRERIFLGINNTGVAVLEMRDSTGRTVHLLEAR